jgi:hypothetical protein
MTTDRAKRVQGRRWWPWAPAAAAGSLAAGIIAIFTAVSQGNDPPALTPRVAVAQNLDQGWSWQERSRWYTGTQGSRLLPLAFLRALEQPGSTGLFLDDAHIESLRYVPNATGTGLPLGFAVDDGDDSGLVRTALRWREGQDTPVQWVGLSCSACHTGEIHAGGRRLIIDGGQTVADFQTFVDRLTAALVETRNEAAKFERFARRVLAGSDTPVNRAMLTDALGKLVTWQLTEAAINSTELRYGNGRVDAFGRIFNKVVLLSHLPAAATFDAARGRAVTGNEPNAPVSYPFLWNIHQHNKVQWNGIADNIKVPSLFPSAFNAGAVGRNVGEVIGVFADVVVEPTGTLQGFRSSAQVRSIEGLEQLLHRLRSPQWPEGFGGPGWTLDPARVSRGAELFRAHCATCHKPLDADPAKARRDLTWPIVALMQPLVEAGTDPAMACNAFFYEASSGALNGLSGVPLVGSALKPDDKVASMLTVMVMRVMRGQPGAVLSAGLGSYFGVPPDVRVVRPESELETLAPRRTARERMLATCLATSHDLLAYKARPLNGIWATAPYLHNGSVPTLYDLLLPPADRPTSFWLGTREYDPKKVGYVTDPGPEQRFEFRTRDAQGRPIPGNSNAGHDYNNAGLTPDDRQALVEYMKTL